MLLAFPRLVSRLALFAIAACASFATLDARAATLTVTNTNGSGAGSLRAAIAAAQDDDVIDFDAGLSGVIEWGAGEVYIDKRLSITGPGAINLAVHTAGRFATIAAVADVKIAGLTFSGLNNTSDVEGGAFYIDFGALELRDCVIGNYILQAPDGNVNFSVDGTDAIGGAIANDGVLVAINCSFLHCWALAGNGTTFETQSPGSGGNGGGGAIANRAEASLTNCTFYNNRAVGGIGSNNGDESGFGGGGLGGAIANFYGTLTLQSCTFSGNEATGNYGVPSGHGQGGGVWCSSSATATVSNSIIAGNVAFRIEQPNRLPVTGADVTGTFASGGFNLIGSADNSTGFTTDATNQTGTDASPIDAKLAPITFNGGHVQTMSPKVGSPALDQGNSLGMTTDGRGGVRPVDLPEIANASGGDGSDVGAVEVNPTDEALNLTLTVNTTDDHDDGACTSDDCTLREALNTASASPGTNTINFALAVRGAITLKLGQLTALGRVTINGPRRNQLTIDGAGTQRILVANGNNIVARGLTFANGFISGNTPEDGGAAVLVQGGSFSAFDCAFTGNTQQLGNGGAVAADGSVRLERCEFSGNRALAGGSNGGGGGIFAMGGNVAIASCAFRGNRAGDTATTGFGGAVAGLGAALEITDSIIDGNTAGAGGGISLVGGTLALDRSIVRVNTAAEGGAVAGDGTLDIQHTQFGGNTATSGRGGALFASGPTTISDSSFTGNASRSAVTNNVNKGSGGAIVTRWSTTTVTRTLFQGNAASGVGGAICQITDNTHNESLLLLGCTFERNRGAVGGAIYNSNPPTGVAGTIAASNCTFSGNRAMGANGGAIVNHATLLLANCTLAGNRTDADGGAVYSEGALTLNHCTIARNAARRAGGVRIGDGTAQIRGTLVAENIGGQEADVSGAFTSNGYNLVGKANGATGFGATGDLLGTSGKPLAPGLDNGLKDNGGPTATIALQTGSPAIDAATAFTLDVDQRGTPRLDLGAVPNAASGDGSDIGAYEFVDSTLPSITINDVVVGEADEGTTDAVFTLTLSAPATVPVNVTFATADDTARAWLDYLPRRGVLTFLPGQTRKTVAIPIKGDVLYSGHRGFFLDLSRAANATLARTRGAGTIRDDEPVPHLDIAGDAVREGDSGTVDAVFAVTLSNPSRQPVTVEYHTIDQSASAPESFEFTSGTLTFRGGEVRHTIHVPVVGDVFYEEGQRTFLMKLFNPTVATLGNDIAVGSIVDDDRSKQFFRAPAVTKLSTASASAKNQTVTLIFSGPAPAADVALYTISVNGVEVALESAARATGGVVLSLPAGSLKSGSRVAVQWRQVASDAAPIGSTSVLAR